MEDMCYERRRAEACVDESAHHALVNAGVVLSFGNRTQNSRVAGARSNHQPIGGSDPNHQGIWSPPRAGLGPGARPNHQPIGGSVFVSCVCVFLCVSCSNSRNSVGTRPCGRNAGVFSLIPGTFETDPAAPLGGLARGERRKMRDHSMLASTLVAPRSGPTRQKPYIEAR